MRPLLIAFLGLLLIISASVAAFALLPACGARLPFLGGNCPAPEVIAAEERLSALGAEREDLIRRVSALEREVGVLDCVAATDEPPATASVPPATEPAIDAEAWNSRDLSLLEGCWALDSTFQTVNTQTGVTSRYTTWRMCFGANGTGREEMTSDTGVTCAGSVAASFDAGGGLVIEEPGNLMCGDGAFIYRMVSRCGLNPDGTAACRIEQPEINRAGSVTFRRASGDN